MNKFSTLLLVALLSGAMVYLWMERDKTSTKEQSDIILQQIEEVNKLISLEGSFSEVYTMDQSQRLFFDLIPIPKQALVIANAKTYIAYNLDSMKYEFKPEQKEVIIRNIPEPQVIIEPDVQFYDLKARILPFNKEELTTVNRRAIELLKEEASKEQFLDIAKENLRLNLEKIIISANQQGWTVRFEESPGIQGIGLIEQSTNH